jgi:hypothetical protein
LDHVVDEKDADTRDADHEAGALGEPVASAGMNQGFLTALLHSVAMSV